MDPGTMAAIAQVLAEAVKGGASAYSAGRAAKREAKEKKRQTLADSRNKALQRELDLHKFTSEQAGTNTGRRMQALQEAASGFTRALTGR